MRDEQQFSNFMQVAVQRLAGRDPQVIAQRANVGFDGAQFEIAALETVYTVSWPDLHFAPDCAGWLQLLVLHYLDLADGTPVIGKLTPFGQLKDGMIRGGGFDRRCEEAVQALMECIDEDELRRRCAALGGVEVRSNADYEVCLPFLPNYPVTLKVWFADDEFPASGRVFVDASADHYLTVEDAVTVGEILLECLGDGAGYWMTEQSK